MNSKYTKPNIRQRFTMSEKDVKRCGLVFIALDSYNGRNRAAADVWCAFNPWSREAGGTSVLVQNATRSYLDAAKSERAGQVAQVVRITAEDVAELLAYRDRYMVTEGGLPHVR